MSAIEWAGVVAAFLGCVCTFVGLIFYGGKLGLAPVVGFLGLLLIFALINLEIADYYSAGRYLELQWAVYSNWDEFINWMAQP